MVEIALMTALALILDRIEFSGPWVMGGSITLVMLPIFVMAFRRGVKVGVATGLLVGTLKLVLAHRFSTCTGAIGLPRCLCSRWTCRTVYTT